MIKAALLTLALFAGFSAPVSAQLLTPNQEVEANINSKKVIFDKRDVGAFIIVDSNTVLLLMTTFGSCDLGMRTAYFLRKNQPGFEGCWKVDDVNVTISWPDHGQDVVPKDAFLFNPDMREPLSAKL